MKIAIPDLISNSYFPVIAAVESGFFKREGLDVELLLLFPVTRAMEALRDGGLDFVAGTASAALSAFPEWKGVKLLAAVAQRMYWFLVVRADLGIQRGDVQGIRGLRIGAAPGVDVGLRRLLQEAGIDPEREVSIGPVPGANADSVSFGVTAAQALADGAIDAFWANGMGAEVAARRGVGSIVLDVRRGEGPPGASGYTFSALVTRDDVVMNQREAVAAAVRGLVAAQRSLKEDPGRATEVGRRLFPPMEAELIAELVRRDTPYYDPTISPETVHSLNRFARDVGLLHGDIPYDQIVSPEARALWPRTESGQ